MTILRLLHITKTTRSTRRAGTSGLLCRRTVCTKWCWHLCQWKIL